MDSTSKGSEYLGIISPIVSRVRTTSAIGGLESVSSWQHFMAKFTNSLQMMWVLIWIFCSRQFESCLVLAESQDHQARNLSSGSDSRACKIEYHF
ncbi:hypothetical protein SLA2020_171850 [Shorea laevis]